MRFAGTAALVLAVLLVAPGVPPLGAASRVMVLSLYVPGLE
jgi:hypothetical protein